MTITGKNGHAAANCGSTAPFRAQLDGNEAMRHHDWVRRQMPK